MGENIKNLPCGFINVNKPPKMTSHDVVACVRKILGIKQVGHTGTLDPFATGVLPVAIGKATKLIEYLPDDKEYIATIQFGKNTSTYDIEGETVQIFDKKINEDDIKSVLKNFEGEISQIPPLYSAIKLNGKKLYEYARAGETVDVKPRKITIHKIELLDFDEKLQLAKILIACLKGTYIRSIAYDMGNILGCGGYLAALERTKAGNFSIENSINLEDLKNESLLSEKIINPLKVIDIPVIELNENEAQRVSHGMFIRKEGYKNSDIVFLVYGGKIHAIGKVNIDKIMVKKVFEVL